MCVLLITYFVDFNWLDKLNLWESLKTYQISQFLQFPRSFWSTNTWNVWCCGCCFTCTRVISTLHDISNTCNNFINTCKVKWNFSGFFFYFILCTWLAAFKPLFSRVLWFDADVEEEEWINGKFDKFTNTKHLP